MDLQRTGTEDEHRVSRCSLDVDDLILVEPALDALLGQVCPVLGGQDTEHTGPRQELMATRRHVAGYGTLPERSHGLAPLKRELINYRRPFDYRRPCSLGEPSLAGRRGSVPQPGPPLRLRARPDRRSPTAGRRPVAGRSDHHGHRDLCFHCQQQPPLRRRRELPCVGSGHPVGLREGAHEGPDSCSTPTRGRDRGDGERLDMQPSGCLSCQVAIQLPNRGVPHARHQTSRRHVSPT